MDPAARLVQGLAELDSGGLRRRRRVLDSAQGPRVEVDGRSHANFSSNDYLGLANHPSLRAAAREAIDKYGVGAGASPLVSGHQRAHALAEERFARFCGLERALLFPSGYAANLGIVAAMCDRHAEVFGDRLNHACLNDAAILSRATFTRYRHLDADAIEAALAASGAATKLVATDAVFSMDGDVAPLPRILAACERHDAWLVVDDAHGIGVLGPRGHGVLEHFALASPRLVYMATLGKALGGYGAFVAGSDPAIEWLLQRARTLIYSTALPPMVAAVAVAAMDLVDAEPERVERLRTRTAEFRSACTRAGVKLPESSTAIQPVIVGDSARAVCASAHLVQRGHLVPAIRPPTVPEGTARLRVSLSADHSQGDVEALADAIADTLHA